MAVEYELQMDTLSRGGTLSVFYLSSEKGLYFLRLFKWATQYVFMEKYQYVLTAFYFLFPNHEVEEDI